MTKPAELWVDVTTLLRAQWTTGVPRMIQQVLHHWTTQSVPHRLCYFDPEWRIYRETATYRPTGPAPQPPQPGTPPSGPWARMKRLASRALPASAIQAGRHFAEGARCLVRPFVRRLRRSRVAAPMRPPEAPFGPGDLLLAPGFDWVDNPARDALPRLRREAGLRVATVIYDITPLRCPQLLIPGYKPQFEAWLKEALAATDLVLTISEFSRQDLQRYCRQQGLACPPVQTVRLGDELGQAIDESPVTGLELSRGFALCVGTISQHKNQWLLLHVWRRLLRAHGERVPQLVLVGGEGWRQAELQEQVRGDDELAGHVLYLPRTSDAELRWLYRHCRFTVFPSFYEGWGLPVAESLAHGKPCLCSSAASLPEVGGDLADYFDPYDGGECQRLIERAITEPGWLEQRQQRIRREHRVTSWAETARQAGDALRRAA